GPNGVVRLAGRAALADAAMEPPAPPASPAPAASAAATVAPMSKKKNDLSPKTEEGGEAEKSVDRSVADANVNTPSAVRKDFAAPAALAPRVTTAARGHASPPLKLPDNLTRYRVMAVAAWGDRSFGSNESTITARLPIMVRPSAPRFLNFGDRFELPV